MVVLFSVCRNGFSRLYSFWGCCLGPGSFGLGRMGCLCTCGAASACSVVFFPSLACSWLLLVSVGTVLRLWGAGVGLAGVRQGYAC